MVTQTTWTRGCFWLELRGCLMVSIARCGHRISRKARTHFSLITQGKEPCCDSATVTTGLRTCVTRRDGKCLLQTCLPVEHITNKAQQTPDTAAFQTGSGLHVQDGCQSKGGGKLHCIERCHMNGAMNIIVSHCYCIPIQSTIPIRSTGYTPSYGENVV